MIKESVLYWGQANVEWKPLTKEVFDSFTDGTSFVVKYISTKGLYLSFKFNESWFMLMGDTSDARWISYRTSWNNWSSFEYTLAKHLIDITLE